MLSLAVSVLSRSRPEILERENAHRAGTAALGTTAFHTLDQITESHLFTPADLLQGVPNFWLKPGMDERPRAAMIFRFTRRLCISPTRSLKKTLLDNH